MEPKDLVKFWGEPDNSRLTKKQYAMRFPVHVMAKVNAINEMYPAKTRMEIMGDLLAAALEQFRDGLSSEPHAVGDAGRDPDLEWCGQRREFEDLVAKHMKALEQEEQEEREAASEGGGGGSQGKERKRKGTGQSGKQRAKGAPRRR